jgi:Holliday junction DNA helicase RuvA
MISYIKGRLTEVGDGIIVVENNGMGFNIHVPATVISSFSAIGDEVKVYTYLQIREDAHSLFGFLSRDDLNIFKMLINVNGIGPKGALAILSTISPDDLRFAILSDDAKLISSAPGIGGKTAQKVILELKDKIKLEDTVAAYTGKLGNTSTDANGALLAKDEAVEALVSLGYGSTEAMHAVREVENADELDAEAILKQALKKLAMF